MKIRNIKIKQNSQKKMRKVTKISKRSQNEI